MLLYKNISEYYIRPVKKTMKRILFIHHAAGWGGAPISMINIINSLDKSEYDVQVLLLKNSIVAEKLAESGIKYKIADNIFYKYFYKYYGHTLTNHTKWFQLGKLIRLTLSWILSRYFFAPKILKNYNVDIVHLNSSVLTDWLAPCKSSAKVIIHIREPFANGTFGIRSRFFRSQMKKYADCIIAISNDNSTRIGIPDKTVVIYNYSNLTHDIQAEHSYSSKKALYLGGFAKFKGFYTMVAALDYLDKDLKLYFAGLYVSNKTSQNKIKQILKSIWPPSIKQNKAIQKIYNHPNAVVLGLINNVETYIDEVCCLVSPFSIPHFSRPVIEAHLRKKPVIGTDVEGMDEIIKHEVNGMIVPKDNPRELAKAINELTANPRKAKTFGEAGYNVAVEKYTPKNIDHFKSIYAKLLK